jgi:hypothetical protein
MAAMMFRVLGYFPPTKEQLNQPSSTRTLPVRRPLSFCTLRDYLHVI